jgi:hypothetical protein
MSAKKVTSTIPAARLALYDKLLATVPGLERKGATIPYTSTDGKMFTSTRNEERYARSSSAPARRARSWASIHVFSITNGCQRLVATRLISSSVYGLGSPIVIA